MGTRSKIIGGLLGVGEEDLARAAGRIGKRRAAQEARAAEQDAVPLLPSMSTKTLPATPPTLVVPVRRKAAPSLAAKPKAAPAPVPDVRRRAPKATKSATGERVRGGILGTPDLRTMSTQDAIKTASSEPHLVLDSTGQYHGAPEGVRTPEDLQAMRAKFDAEARAGIEGADWYVRARKANREWAGSDPKRQELIAREEALWSAQAPPDSNLGFAFTGHNAYEMGTPLDRVRTGQQAKTYNTARDSDLSVRLGPKTGIYGQHLDPTVPFATTGTNDIWHARSFGYNEPGKKMFSRALKEPEHRFLDYETLLAVNRANEQKWGGRTDWTAHEIQAAPWVAAKGRGLAEQAAKSRFAKSGGMPTPTADELAEGINKAKMTYPDYANKYTAYGTSERVPYVDSGHLEGVARGDDAVRAEYSNDPRRSWQDEEGRDIITDALGLYQRSTLPATGFYTPPGGVLENNPATVTRPFVGIKNNMVDDPSRGGMTLAEGLRAYTDAQGSGAWHRPDVAAKPGMMGSIFVPHEGPIAPETLQQLQALGEKHGLRDVVDTGQGATVTSFGDTPSGKYIGSALKKGLSGDVRAIIPGSEPSRAFVDSGYIPMFEQEGAVPGGGQVTRSLRELVESHPQSVMDKLDADAALRRRYLSGMYADEETASQGLGVARPDVQMARKILAEGGLRGLFGALDRGVALPAIGGGLSLGAYGLSQGQEQGASPGY